MNSPPTLNPYKHHRFPAEIISHCVWLYFRFCLSYRDVEEHMAARGILLTYEGVRYWCRKFGQHYANQLRRWRPRPGDKWHLDKFFSPSTGNGPICGAPSTRMAMASISSYTASGIRRQRRGFSASC